MGNIQQCSHALVIDNPVDQCGIDMPVLHGIAVHQAQVADTVDEARDAFTAAVYRLTGGIVEQSLLTAGMSDPVPDIVTRLFRGQPLQVVIERYTLRKLFQIGLLQAVAQLLLPHQDNLQHEAFFRVDVGQHTQLFQGGRGEVLRLVDNQQCMPVLRILADGKVDKLPVQFKLVIGRARQAVSGHHPLQQFAEGRVGI